MLIYISNIVPVGNPVTMLLMLCVFESAFGCFLLDVVKEPCLYLHIQTTKLFLNPSIQPSMNFCRD